MKIYIDGDYYDSAQAKISVLDHGFLYGDGIFEGIRIYRGKIFRAAEHVRRLFASAKGIYLDIGVTPEAVEKILREAVEVNQKKDGYIRLIVSRGEGPLGIDPSKCQAARLIVIVGDIQLYPEKYYAEGISVITSSYRRIPVDCLDVRIKSLNYLNNILAKMEANRAGCLESIMLNREGFVVECTGDNIFMVKAGELLTPPTSLGALEGITRAAVLELAAELGIPARETLLTRLDFYNAEECFLTGTAAEIMPVSRIDGNVVGAGVPGRLTGRLQAAFRKMTGRE